MGFEYILGCWDGRIDAIPRLEYVHRLSIFSFLGDAISGEPLPERNPISPHTIYDVSTLVDSSQTPNMGLITPFIVD